MMMPGREVKMLIFSLLAARSISTRDDAGVREALLQVLLERQVLEQQVGVLLLGVPAAAPGLVEAQAEPDGMDFLTHGLRLPLGHLHREVGGALDDAVGAAHGGRPHALHGRALVGVAGGHHQVVLVQASLLVLVGHVHRVGDGRAQRLLDLARHRLLGEAQDGEGFARLLAADEVHDQARLLGRGPHVFGFRLDLQHVPYPLAGGAPAVLATFSTLDEWPLNCRVGENSPSLWPTMFSVMYTGMNLRAVVDGQRVADHLRRDGRAARPGLHDLAVVGRVHRLDLLHHVIVDERALLQRAWHVTCAS